MTSPQLRHGLDDRSRAAYFARISHVAGWAVQETRGRPTVGMSLYEFLRTHDPAEPAIAHHLAALDGHRQSFRYDFEGRWYAAFIHPLRDDGGQVTGCLGAAFDVTEQRAMEQRLVQGEARLAEAQRVAHVGSFEWDIESGRVTWSDELHRIHGIQPGTFEGSYESFLEFVHPDDVDYTNRVIFDAYRRTGQFIYEHRIVRPDGIVRVVHTRGDVICDEGGKPARVVGSCWDVTELKDAMNALERARSLLEATIEATADGILVVDCDGVIRARNRRFLSLWGIPEELAEQADDEKLLSFVMEQLEDPEAFIRGVRELYGHPHGQSFDVLRFKDGRVFERYSTPQRLGDDVVGRVWSFRDVTERERLLRRALFLADAARLLASLDVEPALDSVARLAVPYVGDGCAVDLLGNGGPRRLLVVSRDPTQAINPELHSAVVLGHPTIYEVAPRSYMAVPLVVKDAVIGAMTFVAAPGRRYSSHDLELAEELARRAALSLQNARLYEGAQAALKARDEFLSVAAHEIRGPITSMHMARAESAPKQGPGRGEAAAASDHRTRRSPHRALHRRAPGPGEDQERSHAFYARGGGSGRRRARCSEPPRRRAFQIRLRPVDYQPGRHDRAMGSTPARSGSDQPAFERHQVRSGQAHLGHAQGAGRRCHTHRQGPRYRHPVRQADTDFRAVRTGRVRASLRRARPRVVHRKNDRLGSGRDRQDAERVERRLGLHRRAPTGQAAMTQDHQLLMVVDDDEDIREVAKLLLEIEGYRVATASDGADAWKQVNESERPSLILLDLMMPRMDGEQFIKALRASPLANIPVVIMSGQNAADDKAKELAADDCLTKPTDLEQLLRTVRRCLNGRS